jgi:hypothetical protein
MTETISLDIQLLERIANTLERMATTLGRMAETQDRIEIVLEERENRTLESKEARQLMQDIVKYYAEIQPPVKVEIGRKLHVYGFRQAISVIKNIKNSKHEPRRLTKWIRRLEDLQFIHKLNTEMFEVLDIGKDWGEYE